MIDFDFLPRDYHRCRSDRRSIQRHGALVALMVLVMGGWVYAHGRALREVDGQLGEIQRQRAQIRVHQAGMKLLMAQREALVAREKLANWLNDRSSAVVALAAVSRVLPADVGLSELALSSVGIDLPPTISAGSAGATPPPSAAPPRTDSATQRLPGLEQLPLLRLWGVAASSSKIGDFAAGLTGQPYFVDVTTDLQGRGERAGLRGAMFEISCRLVPQVGGRK